MSGNPHIEWQYSDGGRAEAGYKGDTGDCVTRAIAIASQTPYQEVYDTINELAKAERPRQGRSRSSARLGVHKATIRKAMSHFGGEWTPTMSIGSGTTVHLRADELPKGRIVVRASKHVAAVIDSVLYDTNDTSRDGARAVYGYWTFQESH